jgi:hypothetical protein
MYSLIHKYYTNNVVVYITMHNRMYYVKAGYEEEKESEFDMRELIRSHVVL